MQNDKNITISNGASRKSTNWQPAAMLVSEFWAKFKTPARSKETLAEYLRLKKPQQDELKDSAGGFVGGTLNGTRRKASAVIGRDLITLDFDNIPAGGTEAVLRRVEGLGCNYCVYSTRKHQPSAPRLRVLLPISRTVTADEYEPLARKMAEYIGIEWADPTTFEVSRLMYYPTCCSDSQYIYETADKLFIDADIVLAQYADWHNTQLWPQVPGEQQAFTKLAAKQDDPEAKPGTIGAFCRTYDIYRAMDELLPGVYEAVDDDRERFTYAGGSTTGGAVVYDAGKFLYSHHATDPCGNKLVNAFDLVRLHKFGDKDDEATPGAPTNRMPSYTAMMEYANTLQDVSALINTERYNEAVKDFDGVTADNSGEPANWMAKLLKSANGNTLKDPDNVLLVLKNDPKLAGRINLDTFSDLPYGICPLPWGDRKDMKDGTIIKWDDPDDNNLALYIKRILGFWAPNIVAAGLSAHLSDVAHNPVQSYLKGLRWDGTPRLDTLFIDYLGADDNIYTRAVTRKGFCAAVARAMTPGCKFDSMIILSGPQGIGKSTLLSIMAGDWFNDSIRTFEGKEASELLQGTWIVEVAELDAFRGADVNRIKQFLSVKVDKYRKAYGRRTGAHPRSCVFFGTTNACEYLQDTTGNRRFWPIDTGEHPATKNIFTQLSTERDQIWAEAVTRWQAEEPLYITGEIEEAAKARQEDHMDVSPLEGSIQAFLDREVPLDWDNKDKWSIDARRMYWGGSVMDAPPTIPRKRICIAEIWVEMLGKQQADLIKDKRQSHELGGILRRIGWKPAGKVYNAGPYGKQKYFERL